MQEPARLALAYTRASVGIEAPLVTVEAHISNGMPAFSIVGLPETAVKESKDRVRSAILNTNFTFPDQRITVNLAPADLPKSGGRFDLAIAVGILAASGQLQTDQLGEHELLGELALSGELRPVWGILPAVLACRRDGRRCLAPVSNSQEAALVEGGNTLVASHLLEICHYLTGAGELAAAARGKEQPEKDPPDLRDVRGRRQAKRALSIAAAGGHNLLLRGPPGTGKTMLASRMPGILPPLSNDQALEVASIRSVCGRPHRAALWHRPPFRAPHHTSSAVALVGGGRNLKAGEVSLAHYGVLFLDELPEFSPKVLEALREPLEAGVIQISRAGYQVSLPSRFQLVAAMNPCPCGYFGDPRVECRCRGEKVTSYQSRVSGPLMDRIDLHVEMAGREEGQSLDLIREETDPAAASAAIRADVVDCREVQLRRGNLNAHLAPGEISTFCRLRRADEKLLETAAEKLNLSPRAYHRVLKIARTIADLAGEPGIERPHLLEAISYRVFDRRVG